jgi:hypothetical protein
MIEKRWSIEVDEIKGQRISDSLHRVQLNIYVHFMFTNVTFNFF